MRLGNDIDADSQLVCLIRCIKILLLIEVAHGDIAQYCGNAMKSEKIDFK